MINKGIRERRERHLATKATKATKGAFINKGGAVFWNFVNEKPLFSQMR